MPGGPKLTHKQQALLAALLSQPTIAQAAAVAGISEATAGRWLKEPAFRAAYTAARQQALSETLALLQQGMQDAVLALRTLLADDLVAAPTKVAAIRTMLEFGLRSVETETLAQRLTVVEATLATMQEGTAWAASRHGSPVSN
jgi:hypothetical protein